MKKKVIIVLIAMMAVLQNAFAYDFSAMAPSGQTLCYTIISNTNSAVIERPNGLFPPTGNLIIPSSVTNNGTTYTVTAINNQAFEGCTDLISVTIPSTVTMISYRAFAECSGLTSVTIGSGVTYIGGSAFYNCSSLSSVTIPNSVNYIDDGAFLWCSSLDTVFMMPLVPPTLGSFSVFNHNAPGRVIILNGCSYDSYYNNSSWSEYNYLNSILNSLRDPIIDITLVLSVDNTINGVANIIPGPSSRDIRCDSTAVIEAIANEGYLFDHWSDGNTDNPRTLTVTQDTSLVAYFVLVTTPSTDDSLFTVVANNAMGGGVYPSGSTAIVFAVPQVDLQFAGWNDGENANPRYIVVTSDTTLTALYRAPDTVRVYDTTTVYDTVINMVYDTTEYNHYYYDTTHVYDTLIVYDTTRVYDTMVYVNIDTLHHYYYDTTRVFDTMVYVNLDTLNHYYYDTTTVYDTLLCLTQQGCTTQWFM